MVVGHNPGMHELALMLAGSGDTAAKKSLEDNLPTAGLAILDFAIDDWNEVAFRRGKLVRFTSPKLLKQALDDGVTQLGRLDIVCSNAGIARGFDLAQRRRADLGSGRPLGLRPV